MSIRERFEAALAGATSALKELRASTEKGFSSEVAEAGVHVHNLERESSRTKLDGLHQHVFKLPAAMTFRSEDGDVELTLEEGALIVTQEDGPHAHELAKGRADVAKADGSDHRHIVVLADDAIELITDRDGAHEHTLQVESSGFDGAHRHRLHLADLRLESLTGAEFWEATGKPAQLTSPPSLPASELARMAEDVDPLDLDVRIANIAVGKSTLVVDPVEDVRKLADLDPSLCSIAQCDSIDEIAAGVITARLAAPIPVVVWQAEPPKGVLPALKVPDPKFLVERLRDGKSAALLSRRRRVGRVGRPQALVNEVAPRGPGKSFIWAVVAQGDPVPVETMADLTEDQRAGLDELTAREFSTESGLWYLPLDLVVVFDPPLELKKPPSGRRFGSSVDFDRDVVKSRQITIDQLLRDVARKEVHGFVKDPSIDVLRRYSVAQLVELDRGLHQLFERAFAGTDATNAEGVTREDVVNAHVFVLAELDRRDVETVEVDELAEASAELTRGKPPSFSGLTKSLPVPAGEFEVERARLVTEADLRTLAKTELSGEGKFAPVHPSGEKPHADDPITLEEVLAQLDKPMGIRMPAVYLVGSVCNKGVSENDIDILIRGPLDEETLHILKFRLGRALEPRLSQRVQFHSDEGGPFTNHVPLFDLVLVPHEDRTLKEMAVAKADDPLMDWPEEPGAVPAVWQFHFRGKSLHGDLRMKVGDDYLVGWTIAIQKAGAVPEVETLTDARKVAKEFSVDGSQYTKPMILPARLFATPKSRQPLAWLDLGDAVVEPGGVGATRNEPGVYVEVSRPKAEWGLQKAFAHEYFLTGDKDFAGRLTFRRLEGGQAPGDGDLGHGEGETFWTVGFAKVALPSVLATRSVRNKSMPPLGHSGMPETLMRATPKEFRFWLADSEAEARKIRDELVAARHFTEDNVVVEGGQFRRAERKALVEAYDPEDDEVVEKAALADFALSWQWWKGQTVVRGAPSREVWHLLIGGVDGVDRAVDYQLQTDPLSGEKAIAAVRVEGGTDSDRALTFEGEVEPGRDVEGLLANNTKNTPSHVAVQDHGKVELLIDEPNHKQLRLKGKKLKGIYTLVAEEAGSNLWLFAPGEKPPRAVPQEKARGDGHVHKLPAPLEGMTDPASGRDHRHPFGDGLMTGPSEQPKPGRDVRHRHTVEIDGNVIGTTGVERKIDGSKKAATVEKRFRTRPDGTQVWNPKDIDDGDDKGGDRLELRPPALFQPMKPAPRDNLTFTDPDEAARTVFTDQLVREGLQIEPKLNGFRAVAERWDADVASDVKEGGVLVFTEDAQRNIAPNLKGLADDLDSLGGNFILDAEIMAVGPDGGFLPRRDLARFRSNKPVDDKDLRLVVFDILFASGGEGGAELNPGNVTGWTQAKRRRLLEQWWKRNMLDGEVERMILAPRRLAKTRSALRKVMDWATKEDGSEGAMVKHLSSTYSLGGEQDLWAKVKAVREVRALVIDRHEVEGSPGVYNFVGAVGPIPEAEVDEWKEVVEHEGRPYVVIGKTGNRKLDAKVGDTILVQVFEILWEEGPPRRIRWFGPAQALDVVDGAPMKPANVRAMLREGELKNKVTKRIDKSARPVRLLKRDGSEPEERYVFGVVLVPDEPDAQGDIYSAEEVRKAAHSFMEQFGGDTFKIMHDGKPVDGVVVLETYLAKVKETHGGETFPVGTWFLATRVVNDDLWGAIQRGAFTGYSMGGTALREALAN